MVGAQVTSILGIDAAWIARNSNGFAAVAPTVFDRRTAPSMQQFEA